MRTTFQDLLLLTFAVEPERLAAQLPPGIRPRIIEGRAFVSIVIASMRGMRPRSLPEFLGVNAYQIVYRAVVEAEVDCALQRGVFFLRSDCNDPALSFLGNQMTAFRFHYFHTSSIGLYRRGNQLLVSVETRDKTGDLVVVLRDEGPTDQLPPIPQFASTETEHRELVELFHAYGFDERTSALLDMEIDRGVWKTNRLQVVDLFSAFFQEQGDDRLAGNIVSAISIRECEYLWKPTRTLQTSRASQPGEPR